MGLASAGWKVDAEEHKVTASAVYDGVDLASDKPERTNVEVSFLDIGSLAPDGGDDGQLTVAYADVDSDKPPRSISVAMPATTLIELADKVAGARGLYAKDRSVKTFDDFIAKYVQQDHIIQFFAFDHLKGDLREASEPFARMAAAIVMNLPRNPERTVALRKLLEAKDAAVRARFAG